MDGHSGRGGGKSLSLIGEKPFSLEPSVGFTAGETAAESV